jgi:chromosome segregation ATPase
MSNHATQQENERLKEELEQSLKLAADLRIEVAEGLDQIQRMMGELDAVKLQNETLNHENQRLQHGVDPTMNDVVGKYQIATVELNNASAKIEALEKVITRLKAELLHANALVDSLRQDNEVNSLAKKSLHAQLGNIQKEREGLKIGTYWLSENVNQLAHTKKELSMEVKKDAEELTHVHVELEEEKAKNARLTAKLSEVAEELVSCQGKLALVHMEKPGREAGEICSRAVRHTALFTRAYASSLRKELVKSKTETKESETRLKYALAANENLETDIRSLRFALSNDAANHEAEITALTAKIGKLSRELIALEIQLSSKQEGYKHLHESIDVRRSIAAQRMLSDFEAR